MSAGLARIIDAFGGLEVLVVGEAMLDSYLEGTTGRLCREAPVPIVAVNSSRDAPGGAANAAANAAALGARVRFLSVVGDDAEGETLRRILNERGVDTDGLIVDPSRRTLSKQRVVASSHLLLRFDQGSTEAVAKDTEDVLIDKLHVLIPACNAVVVSDYGYGVLTPRMIRAIEALQARSERVLVVDAKDLPAYRRARPTAVKPNYAEALQLLNMKDPVRLSERAEAVASRGEVILERTGARLAAVTLDTDGAVVIERGRPPYRTFARPERHSRAAGAGDTFLSALGMALAAGAETPAAAEIASAAAAVVVGEDGTSCCSARALRERVDAGDKPAARPEDLAGRLEGYRRDGKRVVLTNGCFDILHRGHITYLSRAKALGDVLVIGVNSDEGIRRLKGPSRPINTLEDRVQVLAALSCVDHIVPFDEDTPCELVRAIRPDVFVKGGDYTLERLPEAAVVAEMGGVVRILPFVADRSTTSIIERVRAAYADTDAPRPKRAARPRRPRAPSQSNGHGNGHTIGDLA